MDDIEKPVPNGMIMLLEDRLRAFTLGVLLTSADVKRNMQQKYDFSRLVNQK